MSLEEPSHYDQISAYYDLFKSEPMEDYPFYQRLAREGGGAVLELAFGMGRLLLELAHAGFRVCGVDISSGMLACATRKLKCLSEEARARTELHMSDIRECISEGTYGLIFIAANNLFHLNSADERKKIFTESRRRLKPGGCFAHDAYVWGHRVWGDRLADVWLNCDGVWEDPMSEDGVIQRFRSDVIARPTFRLVRTVFCDHVSKDGHVRRVTLRDEEKYVPPHQLAAELTAAGFKEVDVFGGFGGDSLFDPSMHGRGRQVFVAR